MILPETGRGTVRAANGGGADRKLTGPMRTVGLAKRLRREMSLPEVLLWRALRLRPVGLKFRRQHPAGEFVLDFYCAQVRLAVEVDGTAHDDARRVERDRSRDIWLAGRGVSVVRIPAGTVLKDAAAAVEMILSAASRKKPLHQPPAGPPPHIGEDL